MLFGSIEAGGTKFVCSVGNEKLEIIDRVSFPTETPEETLDQVVVFFKKYQEELVSIGVGSFGPIDIDENSETYGYITATPKIKWQNFNFVGTIKQHFDVPVAWTTDVNAAVYGEYTQGSAKKFNSAVYYTIGTGVGGGAIQDNHFIEGFSHPEMGHMTVKKHAKDSFEGNCPFHGSCLEGLASGPAIEKRLKVKAQNLKAADPFWDVEAYYIAQCVYNTTLMLSPEIIILGGGVMKQEHLLHKIRIAFVALMNGYAKTPDMADYIVTPKLGDNAATIGCLEMAKRLVDNS